MSRWIYVILLPVINDIANFSTYTNSGRIELLNCQLINTNICAFSQILNLIVLHALFICYVRQRLLIWDTGDFFSFKE